MWQRLFSPARSARRRPTRTYRLHQFESLEQRAMLTATPVGGELVISQMLAEQTQRFPVDAAAVAVPESGGAIVAYNARGLANARLAGDDREIFVQKYDTTGATAGDLFVANTITRGRQYGPAIDAASDGSYWVIWNGRGPGDRSGVLAQRFASDGTRLNGTLLVNQTLGGVQTNAEVSVAADGTAVVVWEGVGDGDFDGVFARVIRPDGTFATEELLVNQTTSGQQSLPAVAIADFGAAETGSFPGFVVTWSSRDEDGSDWGIFARGFDGAGVAEADAFRVNTTTAGSQYASDIDAASDGSFVIVWNNFSSANGWDATAQRFMASGTPIGTEFLLHDANTSDQRDVSVAVATAGEILTAWSHAGTNGAGWETQLRTFNQDGTADGDVVTANQAVSGANSGNPRKPAVAVNDMGDSIVVYQGQGADQQQGLFGQRFSIDVEPAQNVAPRLTTIADQRITVGSPIEVIARATDANRDNTLTFRLEEGPANATLTQIDNNSARITWTPTLTDRDPNQRSTNVAFRVTVDDDGTPPLRDAASFLVIIDNRAPAVDLNGPDQGGIGFSTTLATEDTRVALVDADATLSDTDQLTIQSMTVTIRNPDNRAAESLQVDTLDTLVTSTYDSATARLTLNGVDTPLNYQRVLRTLQYINTASSRPSRGERLIDVVANDGFDASAAATVTLSVRGVNTAPTLAEIAPVTLLSGSPLHIPLNGTDADGDPITYTVTSSSSTVTPTVLAGNRSALISVQNFGDMVFELFEQEAPRATQRIIQLAEDGFYDGIIFHRVSPNFVIQAGDPTATGSGGSGLADFDDQFNPNLQHNRSGVLSMAKSVDDTNDSQFFITDSATRFLDSNHTVFGQLIEGDSVREAIQNVSVNPSTERPLTDVVIQSFEIFTDTENGLLRLSAPEGTSGAAVITVTASDGLGGTAVRQFNVTVTPDTTDNPPYLNDIPRLQTTVNTPVTFQLQATDLESDPVIFLDQAAMTSPTVAITPLVSLNNPNLQFSVDRNTGLLTVTPTNGLTGTFQFTVGVAQSDQLSVVGGQQRGPFDLQVVEVRISTTGIET